MKNQFKDVAHLYSANDDLMAKVPGGEIHFNFQVLADFDFIHHGIKPILRPLSDMAKGEMKQLYHIVFGKEFRGNNITHRDVGNKQERWVLWSGVERLFIYKNGDIGADSDLQYYPVHQATVTRWMLSKNFDLFGLIESGQAIDATTLTTTHNP